MVWRAFIKVCYSVGFVERKKKNGNYAIRALFRTCSEGVDLLDKKEMCLLLSWLLKVPSGKCTVKPVEFESKAGTSCSQSPNAAAGDIVKMRNRKGTPPLLNVRRLMNERERIDVQERLSVSRSIFICSNAMHFFAPDHTKLQQSPDRDLHFVWHDAQLSKGKLNIDRLIEVHIGSCEESVYYRSAPCAGVDNQSVIMLLQLRKKGNARYIHHFH